MTKTSFKLIVPLLFLILVLPLSVKAFTAKSDDVVKVNQDQVIEGNFYASGNSITVNGTIKGDIICAGQTININGPVDGDIICVGNTINVNAPVGGNIRLAGNTININSQVARNITAFGNSIVVGEGTEVGWSTLIFGAALDISGKINGSFYGGGDQVYLNANIGKDVEVDGQNIEIGDQAMINGNLTYYSYGKDIMISDQAKISGEIIKSDRKTVDKQDLIFGLTWAWFWGKLISIFSALILGLVIISLFRSKAKDNIKDMLDKPWAHLGFGVVVLLLTPIISVILAITIIGIPLALILMMIWVVLLMVGKVLAGITFGYWLFEKFKWSNKKLLWPMVVGVVVACLIFSIPIIGWIIALLALIWGLGSVWFCCKKNCG